MNNLVIKGNTKKELRKLIENSPVGSFICTAEKELNIVLANNKFYDYIKCNENTFHIKYNSSLINFIDMKNDFSIFTDALKDLNKSGSFSIECQIKSLEGDSYTTIVSGELLENTNASKRLINCCFLDVTKYSIQNKDRIAELHEKAKLDPFTKVLNKTATEESINEFINSNPDNRSCLLMIDIDNFKKVNDILGHIYGDEYIFKNINSLKALIRTSDIIGRVGGDEFIIFIKNLQDKKILFEKLGHIIDLFDKKIDTEYTVIKTSCSIGISLYPQNGNSYETLYAKADKALYSAKNNGKNTYEFYSYRNNLNKTSNTYQAKEYKTSEIIKNPYKTILEMFHSSNNQEDTVDNILEIIAEEFGADRICIYRYFKNNLWVSLSNYWQSSKFPCKEIEELQNNASKWIYDENLLDAYNMIVFDENTRNMQSIHELRKNSNDNLSSLVLSHVVEGSQKKALISLEFLNHSISFGDKRKKLLYDITKALTPFISDRFNYDRLTNLMDRNLFNRYSLYVLKNEFKSIGIIDIDINGLKTINDKFGYNAGDKAIKSLANNLKEHACDNPIFRFSDDEFIIIYPDISFNDFIDNVKHIREGLLSLQSINASTGYSWADEEIDLTMLQKNASDMLKANKRVFYKESDITETKHDYKIFTKQRLFKSMDEGKISFKLQPQIDAVSTNLIGAEALIRFIPEELGYLSVLNFVKTLEDQNLISYIDFFVFDNVCKFIQQAQTENYELVPISVNFSRDSLIEDKFIENINEMVKEHHIDKKSFKIEITETVGTIKDSIIQRKISQLFSMGYSISLDDFGSTYTNLSLVSMLEYNELKIDKSLISLITSNKKASMIVSNIISICQNLNIDVIAEGVETQEELDKLISLNCKNIQGYFFSKPISADDFKENFMNKKQTVVLSSSNKNKIIEIKEILKNKYTILSKSDVGLDDFDVEEDKDTLIGNAMKKAVELKEKLDNTKYKDAIVIADDTGLFVPALDGEPGVYSARYSGENATYQSNVDLLLENMKNLNESKRDAYFETAIAVILSDGSKKTAIGRVDGKITEEEKGNLGFGYDPIFHVTSLDKTMAEMTSEEKNSVSHRGNALRNLTKILL